MSDKLQQAIELFHKNNFSDALLLLKEINQLKAKQSSISLQLHSVCLAKQGELVAALGTIDKAIAISGNQQEKQQAVHLAQQLKLAIKQQERNNIQRSISHLSCKLSDINIVGENDNVVAITRELIQYLIDNGAKFDKQLSFVELGGNLSILSTANSDQVHMNVPLCCMPLLTDYKFTVDEQYRFKALPNKVLLNPKAVPVMALMEQLFNATSKLENWKKSLPFFIYQDSPEIIDQLFTFRPQSKKLSRFYYYFKNNDWQQLLIESFLGSREFTYQQIHLRSANIKSLNNSEKGLLAIIDFLNHRVGDGEYVVNTKSSTMEIFGKKNKETNELFVQYGLLDPFLSYFIYGFVDTSAPFIYSGKCETKLLSGDKLVVMSMSGGIKRATPLPEHLSHLCDYLPPGIKKQGDVVVISDVIFPQAAKKALLNEVIEQILVTSGAASSYKNKQQLAEEVRHIINELVKVNIEFWYTLQQQVKLLSVQTNELQLLCQHSINHLTALIIDV